MIELLGANVRHKIFGVGKVIEHTGDYIFINFPSRSIKFSFPGAFENFLKCEDENMQGKILEMLADKNKKEEEEKRQKSEERAMIMKTQAAEKSNKTRKKASPKENIAFKCNYCDGGLSENGIGYLCACTDEMIKYNIEVKKRSWCCNNESPCKQYYDGIITREKLDKFSEEDAFVCYESQMLRKWTAYAGIENNKKPMKLNKVQVNSLAILTTIEPDTSEEDRFVFGVFLVDEAYEGDNHDEGYVTTSSKYKLSLTKDEAKKVLFWNYYYNENAPKKAVWSQGLHRYINDIQAASILKDIVTVKKGTEDEKPAQEFLEHFCEINSIDISDLPIMEGALQRK